MKLRGKLILIAFIMMFSLSCKKASKHGTHVKIKKEITLIDTIAIKDCISIRELSIFFGQIEKSCQPCTDASAFFSDEFPEHYRQAFCNLINDAIKNIDEEIEYGIFEKCTGEINIISVENITDEDGEKHRNEYATILYVKKINGELKVYNMGGAG